MKLKWWGEGLHVWDAKKGLEDERLQTGAGVLEDERLQNTWFLLGVEGAGVGVECLKNCNGERGVWYDVIYTILMMGWWCACFNCEKVMKNRDFLME